MIVELKELKQLYGLGEFNQVFQLASGLQSKNDIKITEQTLTDELVDLLYLKLSSKFKLNYTDEVLSEVNKYLTFTNLTALAKLKFFVIKLQALTDNGTFNDALEIIRQADLELDNIKKLDSDDELLIALYLHSKGSLFFYRGELDQAIYNFKKALLIRENYHDTQGTSDTINNMGMVYQSLGEFEMATKCYLECISLDQSLNFEKGISYSLNNLGFISLQIGEIEEAYNYFIQTYNLVRKISEISPITENQSEIDYNLVEIILKNIEDNKFIGELFCNLGNTLYKLENIEQSLYYYTKALYVYQKTNNVTLLSDLFVQLITINLDINKFDQVKIYLDMLDKINASESKTIQLRSNFVHALVDNTTKMRFEGKYKALKAFNEIINNEIIDWNISIKTMTILSELLVEEFMIFENPEIVIEAKSIIDKMHTIAKDKKSYSLLVETYILKTKFAVIEGNLDKGLLYLDQAYFTSIEKNLATLTTKVKNEHAKLEADYQSWKDFLKTSSMKERLEKIEMIDYMNKIKNALTVFRD